MVARMSVAAAAIAALSLSALPLLAGGETRTTPKQDRLPAPADVAERVIPAQADASVNLCGKRDSMVADLARQFQEAPLATGMVDEKAVLEIFVSASGSWTILATGTDGMSCVLAVGEGFEPSRSVAGRDA